MPDTVEHIVIPDSVVCRAHCSQERNLTLESTLKKLDDVEHIAFKFDTVENCTVKDT
jgi:hypothetical protein